MAELAASDTGTETVIANSNRFILKFIGKVIATLGHGSDKDANALLRAKGADIFVDSDDGRFETQSDLAAVGR